MINRVFLAGNITADPQLRTTPGGMTILEFGLAVNERRRNQQTGEFEERANFFNLKLFANRAEALSRILIKGMHVSIEGHLHWDSWEDKNTGQKRSKVEVVVDEIELMSPRSDQRAPQNAPTAPQMPQFGPQMQQGYPSAMPPQTAPNMAAQAPQGYGGYQPTVQQPPAPAQTQADLWDSEIPF